MKLPRDNWFMLFLDFTYFKFLITFIELSLFSRISLILAFKPPNPSCLSLSIICLISLSAGIPSGLSSSILTSYPYWVSFSLKSYFSTTGDLCYLSSFFFSWCFYTCSLRLSCIWDLMTSLKLSVPKLNLIYRYYCLSASTKGSN